MQEQRGVLGTAFGVLLAVLQVIADVVIWVLVFSPIWLVVLGGYYIRRRIKQRRLHAGVGARTADSPTP